MENVRPKILVVEDSPTQAAEVRCLLEDAGFVVEVAADGDAGLALVRGGGFDLVLSDIVMPGLSGYELCRAIKTDPDTRDVPVVLLTELSEPADILAGLESGADNYAVKPYIGDDLVRRLRAVRQRAARGDLGGCAAEPLDLDFMGQSFRVTSDRRRILNYFTSAFEDYLGAKRRQWESEAAEAREREKRESEAALARAGRELMSSLDTSVTLEGLCRLSVELLHADRAHTFLIDGEHGRCLPVAGHGLSAIEWRAMARAGTERGNISGLLDRLQSGDIIEVTGGAAGAADAALWPCELRGGMRLYAPLRRGSDTIGFLVAVRRAGGAGTQQRHMLRGLVEIASLALENAHLHEDVEEANRIKGDFVNVVSHELRTPLAVILGYVDLLSTGTFGSLNPQQSETLRRVEENARGLSTMINALLDLRRLERGQLPVVLGMTEPKVLVCALRREVGQPGMHPDIEFSCEIESDLPCLYTDSMRLRAALRNLLDNAFKFTDRGCVTLGARALDDGVEFSVTDTGIGIPEEMRPVLFESFRQGDPSICRRHGGVGMGLYVVRRLVEELGGRMEVDSEVGRGSTFRVWIPESAVRVDGDIPAPAVTHLPRAPVAALSAL